MNANEIITRKPIIKGSKCICTAPTLEELTVQINSYYCSENYVIVGNFAYNTHTQAFADNYFVHCTKSACQYRRAAEDFKVEIKATEEFIGGLIGEPEAPETAPETVPAIAEKAEPTAFEQKFFDRADRKEARAAKTSAQATAKAEAGWAMLDAIPMGQPVHGAKDRRYRDNAGAKIDSGYALMQKADYQERKAEASREYAEKVQSGAIARSDDPEAITKLEKRIAELTEQHEKAKQAVKVHNAEVDRMLKSGELETLVLDPWGQPLKDDASEYAKKHAYTVYYKDGKRIYKATVEQSTTAEIRRLKKRIEEIRKTAEICADSDGWEFDGGHIELNAETGRIQAYFDEIPSEEVRKSLKRDGWKWARSAGAWQKMLNEWNIHHAKQNEILKPIEQAEPEQVQEIQPEETDDFSDIDTQAGKKRLEECGIVNGEITDPEKFAQSPFMQEIKAQFGESAVQPTDAPEDVQAVNNTTEPENPIEQPTEPENKPIKKTGKKSKKQEAKKLTPEEMAAELEKMKQSDDWRTSAVLMLMFTNKNPAIIMCEGIAAGVITFEEFEDYMTSGRMPHYHTYAEWQKMGRQVKTGEHARFKARIWKYTEKRGEMTAEQAESLNAIMVRSDGKKYQAGDETIDSHFIKKEAFFFGIDQTEKAGEIQRFEIGKIYETKAGNITVTGRTETELTFTAAVNGKTYTKEIQQGKKSEFVKINKAGMTAQATAEVQQMQDVPEEQPETNQETAEPETVKFVPNMVYWDKLQIISRTDKTVTVKNILTGETLRKKINVGKPDKRKPTEAEYIKINDYKNLWANVPGCNLKDAAKNGIEKEQSNIAFLEDEKKHCVRCTPSEYYTEAVNNLEAYKRILKEQEAA